MAALVASSRHKEHRHSMLERPISGRSSAKRTTGKGNLVKAPTPCPGVDDRQKKEMSPKDDGIPKCGRILSEQILLDNKECDYSRVYEIDVHASGITAIENLSKFRRLRQLDLSCNHIAKIANLDSNGDLRELKLYDNDIICVENLECLPHLCHLQLQHNRIKSIGTGLRKLKNLTELRLDNNHIATISPSELSPCSRITSLDISNNLLQDISAVNCLANLRELRASANQLHCLVDMSGCKRLEDINVSHNHIADLRGLKNHPHLQILNVSSNRLSTLKSTGKLPSLLELIASDNRIDDVSSVPVYYPRLEILHACDNKIQHVENLACMQQCADMVELHVAGNPLFDHDSPENNYFSAIRHMLPNLEILDGAHVRKQQGPARAPLMRPMSSANAVSLRQVEGQLSNFCDELRHLESDICHKFNSLRSSCGAMLPRSRDEIAPTPPADRASDCDVTARVGVDACDTAGDDNHDDGDACVTARSEASSRCSSRHRILAARSFAAEHF